MTFLYSSSSFTTVSPFLPLMTTGTTSASNAPPFHARSARLYDSMACASRDSREISCLSAHSSAQLPIATLSYASRRPSCSSESLVSILPKVGFWRGRRKLAWFCISFRLMTSLHAGRPTEHCSYSPYHQQQLHSYNLRRSFGTRE